MANAIPPLTQLQAYADWEAKNNPVPEGQTPKQGSNCWSAGQPARSSTTEQGEHDADAWARLERIIMPWMTVTGRQLDFPTALWAKIMKAGKMQREDVMEALQGARHTHEEAVRLNNRVVELEAQVLRLTHENEFMLRLLNERDSAQQCTGQKGE